MSADRGRTGRQMSTVLAGLVVVTGLVVAACSDVGPDTGAVPEDDAPLPVISAYGSYVIDLDNREVVELP